MGDGVKWAVNLIELKSFETRKDMYHIYILKKDQSNVC